MKKVLVIIGPTAVGKTALSIQLAKKYDGEIINGDSIQVYRELNIGSAKITPQEMEGIPHHLLNIKDPGEAFSVALFQQLVREKIDEITSRNNLPIICGGTGLYIQAVLYDFNFENQERTNAFTAKYVDYSNEQLHLMLEAIDPEDAKNIPINNRRRILRALEIYENTHKTKTELKNEQEETMLYDALIIGLDMDRKKLYERINKRVDLMIEAHLLDEVRDLYEKGYRVNAIGYKEFNDYFENEKSLEAVIEEIKKNTRHYAKRQLTYFRNKLPVNWFRVDKSEINNMNQLVEAWVKKSH